MRFVFLLKKNQLKYLNLKKGKVEEIVKPSFAQPVFYFSFWFCCRKFLFSFSLFFLLACFVYSTNFPNSTNLICLFFVFLIFVAIFFFLSLFFLFILLFILFFYLFSVFSISRKSYPLFLFWTSESWLKRNAPRGLPVRDLGSYGINIFSVRTQNSIPIFWN